MWTFVSKEASPLFNTLSRFAIAILPRGKRLLVLWLSAFDPGMEPRSLALQVDSLPSGLPGRP